jgi:hypothetical protein
VDIDSDAIDRLRNIVEEGKVSARKVRDLLQGDLVAEDIQTAGEEITSREQALREQIAELESEADDLETHASALTTLADAVCEAVDQLDEWEGAEGREDKAAAREALLDSLGRLVDTFDDLPEDVAAAGQVGGIDADGYDILSPEEKEANALAERMAHEAVGAWLEQSRTEVIARLRQGEGIPPRDALVMEVHAIIQDHQFRGHPTE